MQPFVDDNEGVRETSVRVGKNTCKTDSCLDLKAKGHGARKTCPQKRKSKRWIKAAIEKMKRRKIGRYDGLSDKKQKANAG